MEKAAFKLKHIEVSKIHANPNNPRGLDILSSDRKFGMLKDSISKFGILVPLVVSPKGDNYLLIDGERRYLAAKKLRIKKVPAYITKTELGKKDVLIRMFHIHHNAEQWDPIPQCHALESDYNNISNRIKIKKITDDRRKAQEIAKTLAKETGITDDMAIDRVRFLRWPRDIIHPLFDKPDKGSYLYITEIEEHIIFPALKNYPEYFERVPVDDVRRFLYNKIKARAIGKKIEVRDAAPIFKRQTHKKSERNKVIKILRELVEDEAMTYQEAYDEYLRQLPHMKRTQPLSPRKLLTSIEKLQHNINNFKPDSLKTSTGKSKASPKELKAAISNLIESLIELKEAL